MPPRPATMSIRCPAKTVPGSSSPIGERYIGRWSWIAMHPVVTSGRCQCDGTAAQKAGDRGIEPRARVLETPMLPLHQSPGSGHCSDPRRSSVRHACERMFVPWEPPIEASYAYLLGSYLGDGYLSPAGQLVIACDAAFPGIVEDVHAAM